MERTAGSLAAAGHEVAAFLLPREGEPAEARRGGYAIRRVPLPDWAGWTGLRRAVVLERWFERTEPLAAAAAAWRPEAIHAVDLDTLLPGARAARRLGVPLVYEDRELCLEKLGQGTPEWIGGAKRWVLDRFTRRLEARGLALEREWIPRAAGFLTASPLYADALEERHGRRPAILLNAPRRSDLPADPGLRRAAGLGEGERIALYQGSITPSGGAQECIAAAREFPPGWTLVFLGVSWMRERLEAEARARGAEGRVRLLPPVAPDVLPGWTRAADLGLAPLRPVNRGQAFSLANKVFEYLHAGLPIVASDVAGQGPFLRALEAGILIPEVTPATVAAAVREAAAWPEAERRARGERLRAEARARWCWEVEEGKLLEVYRRVIH
ncbi:MAG: glycosyltransferase [Planctomycetes bacterium]|nr:glycosyltransferase [Planctomycetota bacterium]